MRETAFGKESRVKENVVFQDDVTFFLVLWTASSERSCSPTGGRFGDVWVDHDIAVAHFMENKIWWPCLFSRVTSRQM